MASQHSEEEEPILKSTMVQMPVSPAHLNDLRETISHLQKRLAAFGNPKGDALQETLTNEFRLLLEGWEKGTPQWISTEQMLMDERYGAGGEQT
jgi:hypothetical protein